MQWVCGRLFATIAAIVPPIPVPMPMQCDFATPQIKR